MSRSDSMPWFLKTAVFTLSIAFMTPLVAAETETAGLFSSHDPLAVEITAPWRKILRQHDDTRWPATLTVSDPDGTTRSFELTVERRGKSRQEVCEFPPIRLRFKKQAVKDTVFSGEKKLKLVTHCDDGERWTQYYVREMLAYRIYNLVTDYSFRVRALQVRYRDVDGDEMPGEHFAFLIEDIDAVADRQGLVEVKLETTRPSQLDPGVTSQLSLFQFMIGNLDWSSLKGPDECCHNARLIGNENADPPLVPVPYDFDASGIVDAHYAVPPRQLGVRSITTRLYRGYCRYNDSLHTARTQFLTLQPQVMSLVENETRLNNRSRRQVLKYLESFYDILADEEDFEKDVVSACRG